MTDIYEMKFIFRSYIIQNTLKEQKVHLRIDEVMMLSPLNWS